MARGSLRQPERCWTRSTRAPWSACATGLSSAWLFQTAKGRAGKLSGDPMGQADVFSMIGRRAQAAGIRTRIGCQSFRATGIADCLRNGGKLEIAQRTANHESARTTGLHDRRQDHVSLDEVERILI